VFTTRYGLIAYIKQIVFRLEKFKVKTGTVLHLNQRAKLLSHFFVCLLSCFVLSHLANEMTYTSRPSDDYCHLLDADGNYVACLGLSLHLDFPICGLYCFLSLRQQVVTAAQCSDGIGVFHTSGVI
jgi:hypothetical protein